MTGLHLTYNDSLDLEKVVGLVYLFAPSAQRPSTRVLGPQVGHLQVRRDQWEAFKAAWLAAGHTASWGFN